MIRHAKVRDWGLNTQRREALAKHTHTENRENYWWLWGVLYVEEGGAEQPRTHNHSHNGDLWNLRVSSGLERPKKLQLVCKCSEKYANVSLKTNPADTKLYKLHTKQAFFLTSVWSEGEYQNSESLSFFLEFWGFFLEFWGFSLEFLEILPLQKVFSWFFKK